MEPPSSPPPNPQPNPQHGPPDVIVIMTDEERAAPSYETPEVAAWRERALPGSRWFAENAVTFDRHYTGSLACVPSRPTMFTGHYPDVHGVTQTDGLAKAVDDSRMRWLVPGEVPTLGHWFRAAGWDTHYDGKWHMSHSDLFTESGETLATNDSDGNIDHAAVAEYLRADPLDEFGFSGWVGPEPHGAAMANSGLRRDPLIADRVCAWLQRRYQGRLDGDPDALRPFLLVASFVNPHDIVLFAPWLARGLPPDATRHEPPPIAGSPTDGDDLHERPAVQAAYRDNYASMYGPVDAVNGAYADHAAQYRRFYYQLHAEVDGPVDQVRRAVTQGAADSKTSALIVRTSDHGELLGSHGGLHQKWFQLYDEATRVPFQIARVGNQTTKARRIDAMATSHVDIVPTLLAAAGIDRARIGARLGADFSEHHDLPGRNLLGIVDGTEAVDPTRAVYLVTRDHIIEGDTAISAAGRAFGDPSLTVTPLPAVASNVEAVVAPVDGNYWKLVRTFDDPALWSKPFDEHRSGDHVRREVIGDQWELYDLGTDPVESTNRATDPDTSEILRQLKERLSTERAHSVPERNHPRPYVGLELID